MSFQKTNICIADKFNTLANLTEVSGGSIWSIKAYKNAAETIKNFDFPISSVNDLTYIPGIGKGIAAKIKEYLANGFIKELSELEAIYPVEALTMTVVPGIGAKTAFKFYKQGIRNFDELVKAAEAGNISNENILRGIKLAVKSSGRLPLDIVLPVVNKVLNALRQSEHVVRAEFAGSVRRGKETVKDVDILVVSTNRKKTVEIFQQFGEELINGDDKSRIIAPIDLNTSIQVDLLFCPNDEFGAALAYFTGSKEHNIEIRTLAKKNGLRINEHGFWNIFTGEKLGGSEESELYDLLGLDFYPPEYREEGATLYRLPKLINKEDITTDWHMHTKWSSDAHNSFEEMALEAKSRGLKAIGVSDHTEKQYGWNPDKIDERRLEAKNAENKVGIKIYAGCETGINLDGTLDWPDEYLDKMDFVIASIHKSHSKDVTERLIAAAKNPKVDIIGHITGRIVGRREIPDADWERIFKACAENNVLVEINGARRDPTTELIRLARSVGCKFVVNSDAHSASNFDWHDAAILTARRAGLTKNDLKIPGDNYEE